MEGDTCIVANTALPLDHPVQKPAPRQTTDLQGRFISPEGRDGKGTTPALLIYGLKEEKTYFKS